jgi:hypothetical protein
VAGRAASGRHFDVVSEGFMSFPSGSGDQRAVIGPWPTRSCGEGLVIEVRTTLWVMFLSCTPYTTHASGGKGRLGRMCGCGALWWSFRIDESMICPFVSRHLCEVLLWLPRPARAPR